MNNKTVMMLVAVIVVAIVAVAVVYIVMDDDETPGITIPEVASGTGTVYGNADGNCYIDEVDLAIIQSIIDGETSLDDFPFADANCDGVVDEEDLAWVQNMIDKVDMKVYVLDTQDNIVSVQYPISSMIVLAGSNLSPLVNVLNITDLIVAAAYHRVDPVRDYGISEGINNGTITQLTTGGTAADLDTISQLDVQVMFTEYSAMYDLDSDENVAILNSWGIDVLLMECRDPGDDTRTMAVFGILLDRGDEAQSYIDFVNGVYNEISLR